MYVQQYDVKFEKIRQGVYVFDVECSKDAMPLSLTWNEEGLTVNILELEDIPEVDWKIQFMIVASGVKVKKPRYIQYVNTAVKPPETVFVDNRPEAMTLPVNYHLFIIG